MRTLSLSFLTNGFLKSSTHHVVAPPPDQAHLDRLGVLYFVQPEDALELRPVDSPVIKRLGYTKAGEGEGMTAGEWVKARVKTQCSKRVTDYASGARDYEGCQGKVFWLRDIGFHVC
jgi:isopenicillin N synthase-like dioxygenase